jgi:hypothetical protein
MHTLQPDSWSPVSEGFVGDPWLSIMLKLRLMSHTAFRQSLACVEIFYQHICYYIGSIYGRTAQQALHITVQNRSWSHRPAHYHAHLTTLWIITLPTSTCVHPLPSAPLCFTGQVPLMLHLHRAGAAAGKQTATALLCQQLLF